MSDQSSLHQDKSPPKRDTSPDFIPVHLRDTPGSTPDEAGGWVAHEAPKAAVKKTYDGPDWTPQQRSAWQAQGDFRAEHGYWPEPHHIKFFQENHRWPKKSEMEPWSYLQQDKEGWHNGSWAGHPSRGSAWKPQFEASNQCFDASRPRSEAPRPLEAAESTVPQAAESHEQATSTVFQDAKSHARASTVSQSQQNQIPGWNRTGHTWWPRAPPVVRAGDDTADCLLVAAVFVSGICCGHFSLR